MKKKIKAQIKNSDTMMSIVILIIRLWTNVTLVCLSDISFLRRQFKVKLGYNLNIHNPTSFNEKLQWLKLYDRRPIHNICSDKIRVRGYVSAKIGDKYLIPLLWTSTSVHQLKKANMPDPPYIIKTNHDSGGTYIVKDSCEVNYLHMQRIFKKLLKNNYYKYTKEWQYKNIVPEILVERLMLDGDEIPIDYKFHCFNGKVKMIQIDFDRHTEHTRNLYDENWNQYGCTLLFKNKDLHFPKPPYLNNMIGIAETLSEEFCFVRVDLYLVNEKIYFGEMTFTPESGYGPFTPQKYDYKFGTMLNLPLNMSKV